jgi:hypothetical protein
MLLDGTVRALLVGTVKTVRSKMLAIALIAAVISAFGGPAFAGLIHPVCAPKLHECGDTARITKCCCDDQGEASNQAGPVESRVQVNPDVTFVPVVFRSMDCSGLYRSFVRPHTSPPRATPLDLPTLFASLLI